MIKYIIIDSYSGTCNKDTPYYCYICTNRYFITSYYLYKDVWELWTKPCYPFKTERETIREIKRYFKIGKKIKNNLDGLSGRGNVYPIIERYIDLHGVAWNKSILSILPTALSIFQN